MIKTLYMLVLSTLLLMAGAVRAQDAATTQPSLLKNGEFATDSNGDGIPDEWPTKISEGVSWVKEDDKLHLKIVSSEAGKNYMLYQRMILAKDHPKVLEMKVKVRYADVKPGEKN